MRENLIVTSDQCTNYLGFRSCDATIKTAFGAYCRLYGNYHVPRKHASEMCYSGIIQPEVFGRRPAILNSGIDTEPDTPLEND